MKKTVLCVAICCILAVSGGFFLRVRHSVRVRPQADYAVPDELVWYRQDAPEWAEDRLGESAYTMKSSGCLVACIAAAVTMDQEPITPQELNQLLSKNAVFDGQGNLQWKALEQLDGYHTEVFDTVSNEVITDCLEQGRYPIVRVRRYGIGNSHYVLIVGAKKGHYLCMDPLTDNLTRLSDYGDRVYAVRCVWYEDFIGTCRRL